MQRFYLAAWVAVVGLMVATPRVSAQSSKSTQRDGAQNLQAVFEQVHRAIFVDKAPDKGVALFLGLVPDVTRLRRALRDDVADDVVTKIAAAHRAMLETGPVDPSRLADARQTVVRVWGATTEEMARYQEGSIPFEHFPSATREVAARLLRPGTTFYAVEYLEPGQDSGMKYHLLYWDGGQWSMLGPVWRMVR